MCLLGVCNLGDAYLASEILRSQMCYLWSEIWGRQDYLGSDISSMSLSKQYISVETGYLIIWGP